MLPEDRVFLPDWESSFPFAHLEDGFLLGDYNEFRVSAKHSPSMWLLVMERSAVSVDVKGKQSHMVERPPPAVMSSNLVKPSGSWTDEDVKAIGGRCKVITWTKRLPDDLVEEAGENILHSKCKRWRRGLISAQ